MNDPEGEGFYWFEGKIPAYSPDGTVYYQYSRFIEVERRGDALFASFFGHELEERTDALKGMWYGPLDVEKVKNFVVKPNGED